MIDIKIGDCREVLKTIPEKSVHCCVTSPPYYGLRDYGVDGQIGLEESPNEYVNELVKVFSEVKRVLRDDGTLWLNLGDSYSGSGKGQYKDGEHDPKKKKTDGMKLESGNCPSGFKPKDLIGIPWRVAFALQADGWYLRSDIIWSKPNPMPESVTDRPTKAHEYVFLLSKSEKYFYDNEAVKEPVAESTIGRGKVTFGGAKGRAYTPSKEDPNYRNGSEQWGRVFDYTESCKNGRNRRSVWNIPTKPYSGAHFATFPLDLIDPCIKAGTSEKGCCPECGAPWVRDTEVIGQVKQKWGATERPDCRPGNENGKGDKGIRSGMINVKKTIGWRPSCTCNAGVPIPCTVLDPFGGSGTVGEWCRHHQRDAMLIELNPEYKPLITERTMQNIPELSNWS
jgi:DNA modification methylase